MALDGVFLNCVKKELSSKLIGGRVDKIYQPSREEVVFQMRTYDGNVKLVFSTSAGTARVHITKAEIENPGSANVLYAFKKAFEFRKTH